MTDHYYNIFDTHAHYDDERFDADRDELLAALPKRGVCGVLNAATDLANCAQGIALAEKWDYCYCAVGVHPHEADSWTPETSAQLAELSRHPKAVAIGEIGLDYHYNFSPREVQRAVFEQQVQLANELSLPIIVHDREAHADTLEILQEYRPKGILHCYSGSAEMAQELLRLDLYIAFGGAVTFKNARRALEAVAVIPTDRLLVETDCPYMTPEPFRGRRCDSSHIAFTAEKLAEIKGISTQELLDITCENAKKVYGIP